MENLVFFILVGIIAFLFTAASIPHIVSVAQKKNLFDTPNSRKLNKTVVPTLGGTSIFIGLLLGITLGGDGFPFYDLKFIFASLLVTFFAGIKDDLVGISARSKLIALSFSIIIIAFFARLRIIHFYGLFGVDEAGIVLSTFITFFLGLAMINAFNLIDGIDGLASSITMQVATVLGIWFSMNHLTEYALLSFALAGSSIAFFLFNVFGKKNKIFMGDTGSLLIGTMLFVLALKFNESNAVSTTIYQVNAAPAVLFSFMAYPLFDVSRVFFLRIFIAKRSPFSPDKNHIHHRLLALGFSHLQATSTIFAANLVFIVGGLVLQKYFNVLQMVGIVFGSALLLSTVLELVLLKKKVIAPGDEHQQLFLPQAIILAANNKG